MAEDTLLAAAVDANAGKPAEAGTQPAADATKTADATTAATQSDAGKTAEGEGASDKSKDGKTDKAKDGAPEKYEFKLPEGAQLDEALVGEFTPLAKELNLSQDQAQKLVDLYAKTQGAAQKSVADHWDNLNKEWQGKVNSDKEYGGADLDKNVAIAKKAIDAFGTPELKDALNLTGVGNHPEVVRFFYRVGKAISDDKFDTATGKSNAPVDAAKLLFPNQN